MPLCDIIADVRVVQDRDPAARSFLEVLPLYQRVYAPVAYRTTHWFWKHKHYLITCFVSQFSCSVTLIEAHLEARLGKGTLIDHGTGVVIGEMAEVGNNHTICQDVTLGGVGTKKDRHHPTIGNNVTTGVGAKILGPFEVSDNRKITTDAVFLKPLQTDPTAVGIPARLVRIGGKTVEKGAHAYSADLGELQEKAESMQQQIDVLERELAESKEESCKRGA